MDIEKEISKGRESSFLYEKVSMVIDRIRETGGKEKVQIPVPDLLTQAKVMVKGEGTFKVVNSYNEN
jgi:hypothetical protein